MLNTNKNWSIKIIGVIFAALNLALILGGLVSCGVEERRSTPNEQNEPAQQLNQNDRDDDEQDNSNNEKDDSNDEKDDKD
ncbi:hypothetical protein A6770_28920 [Nostoc minutum NIES-26]|uniref:Uncharacterized protein n=1 Tax=Nostoc minutum NIES-26 TaxID=1844469 RepID=A0A367QKZ0_9NOSO|nr:hypothetical protein [Dendronalium sp. ChiSLP03b]MDZ8208561.1 hypothetical protein [Dendronalium sp. ChiSLP03b]RCJ23842.1 hypothetical protein A6770_28920 [Nostoc minutum NIES-26]